MTTIASNTSNRQDITRPPAFQFYPRQFSGDDQVMSMDLQETGAHIRLMCVAASSSEKYRVPADERALRICVGNPPEDDWKKIKARLLAGAWKLSADGLWWEQDGLRRTFQKKEDFSEAQRKRANSRWANSHTGAMPDCTEPHQSGIEKTDAQRCSAFASASTNQIHTPKTENRKPACENLPAIAEDQPKSQKTKFVKPTLDAITEYCEARKNGIDPGQFVDYYESKGWRVGNQAMKDWRAAVRNWERRNKVNGSHATVTAQTRNLGAEIEAANRKLASQGFTKNCIVEFGKIKSDLAQKMSAAEWEQWIGPLMSGCSSLDTLVCFAVTTTHADEVLDRYAPMLGEVAMPLGFKLVRVIGLAQA